MLGGGAPYLASLCCRRMKLNVLGLIDVCQAREHSGQVRGPTTGEMEATRKVRVTTNAPSNSLIEGGQSFAGETELGKCPKWVKLATISTHRSTACWTFG